MPRGRVTAIGGYMPPPPSGSSLAAQGLGPTVSSPLFDFKYGSILSWPSPTPALGPPNQVMGYSAAHDYHGQETHEWSQRAYSKGPLNSSPGGMIMLNLGMYEPTVDHKGRPILVPVIIFLLFNLPIELILFFSKFSRHLKFIPLFWTLILLIGSSKNYSSLFGHSVVSHLTSIRWFCVKRPKEDGKKSRLIIRDHWRILAIAFSNPRRRSQTQLPFSMRGHLRCSD